VHLAEAISRQALETAQTLSKYLDAAQDRIAALEEEVQGNGAYLVYSRAHPWNNYLGFAGDPAAHSN
jgi:hypothetical protein